MTSALKSVNNNLVAELGQIGKQARQAFTSMANTTTEQKNKALLEAAKLLRAGSAKILEANAKDMEAGKAKGLDAAMLDRLQLNPQRVEAIAKGMEEVAGLPDPVGKTLTEWERPNGLKISRVVVPLGVIGIIYESRPNVTADAGALCIKSGNAAILRGGSESVHSSKAIVDCLHAGLEAAGLPKEAVQLIPTQDREAVGIMLTMSQYIDIIVPRGGKGLCERVIKESRIPTIQHLDGNCHTYLHAKADAKKAEEIVYNAKLRRTGICGSTETLVVDAAIAQTILPKVLERLYQGGCEIRGDKAVQQLDKRVKPATDADWDTEYLDKIIAVKVLDSLEESIAFINRHSSHHTDAIITEDETAAAQFLKEVDSAIVMHNASTQFADGGEFGMGAEIGISTGRLHARGPVGVEQLTTYKYVVKGNGQVRAG